MTPENKEKLVTNVSNSYKMASNWVMTIAGALFAAFLALPAKCVDLDTACTVSQATLLAQLPVPPWALPVAATLIGIAARLWPQKSISPEEAAAKSATHNGDTIGEEEQPR